MIRKMLPAVALALASCVSAPQPAPVRNVQIAPLVMTSEVQKQREEELAQAQREYDANPDSADAIIWLGRRTAYLGHYREAVDIFTQGIKKHPEDARLYRYRGHRLITLRRFHDAVNDLEYAARLVRGKPDEVEPDGQPNARNTPVGSLHTNIDYHLGLAYYLLGDYQHALVAYRRCLALSNNPDRLVSTTYWLYLTLRKMGRVNEAEKVLEPIGTTMDIIENVAYHKLLLMFSGDIAPEELLSQDAKTTDGATILYGIGAWYYVKGQPEKAYPLWQRVIDGAQWSSFGFIAAEAEIAAARAEV